MSILIQKFSYVSRAFGSMKFGKIRTLDGSVNINKKQVNLCSSMRIMLGLVSLLKLS